MPYLILKANGDEIERFELKGSAIVGRALECDVSVRDILLSRKHCRVEPCTGKDKGRWRFVDLASRNGSHVNWKKVTEYTLVDGDEVRIGRTWLKFHSGAFVPAPPDVAAAAARKNKLVRPADPREALSGTVADFVFVERDANSDFDGTPSPTSPTKLVKNEKTHKAKSGTSLYSPLNELSSSWDSIVATATVRPKRMARPIPRATDGRAMPATNVIPRAKDADLSLQAHPVQIPFLEVVPELNPRRRSFVPALILTAGIAAATAIVLLSGWIMARG